MFNPTSKISMFALAAIVFAALALGFAFVPSARAQTSRSSLPMIIQPVVEANLVRLFGSTRPEANAVNDRGRVADDVTLEHMFLQLRRPSAQEQALTQLIDQMHDPASPNYHQWLTPYQLGAQFGPAPSDIQKITGWLQSHGLSVNAVYPNRMTIDFSGNAGQVFAAFHTAIHYLTVDGISHIANMTDPQIPAALAPVIVGTVSLHDFKLRPMAAQNPVIRPASRPGPHPEFTIGGSYYVTPPDLATIYNFNPLFNLGITGQNQTIYLVEDTNLYTANGTVNDWATFRTGFGIPLSSYPSASLNTVHPAPPSGPNNCSDPGVNGDDSEAILDAEYASASAPGAAIVMATCLSGGTVLTYGWLIAIENLVNGPNPPAIISMSYGDCEAHLGAVGNAAFNSAYQTGVAGGTSIFVSAGDQASSGCERNTVAVHGIAVNGAASTIYNVAVGGTDFSDTYARTNGTYWNSSNTSSNGSAKSYIPEIPWNTTCGSQLYATYEGFSVTYGSTGFCNSSFIANNPPAKVPYSDWGGSGGPSGCATGAASIPLVVSPNCAGYAKPSWQSGVVGIPTDGVRDLPDVSLFSSFGPWSHAYVICYSDPTPNSGGVPCDGTASGWSYNWGGTSFASPIMAGIQALVNQNAGARQGNPNFRLYQLAAKEYGPSGSPACNSSKGNTVSSSCIFYDVTQGDNDVPCVADAGTYYNCYNPSGTYGVLSTSNSSYAPAYGATTGWDFTTGIGTINAFNLVMNWTTVPFSAFSVAQLFVYPNQPGFALNSNFTLGGASNGIDPPTEPVTLEIANFATTIPPGSFVLSSAGTYTFVGVINGFNLKLLIKLTSGKNYIFGATATNVSLTVNNPVTVTLIIGNDSGTAIANALINNATP
jgi:subtilase family serine protease